MALKLEGIFCPMATPLNQSGEGVDEEATKRLVNHLIENGIDGLLPLGTSGEFALLSDEERESLLKSVIDTTNGRVPVIAGVSDTSIDRVIGFAKQAKDLGADAAIATPVYYFSTKPEKLYDYYRKIAESVDIPLMIYNIPDYTGALVPPDVVQRLAEDGIIAGMKYTQYNFLELLEYIQTSGQKAAIFTGSDAMAYTALDFGARGAIIGVANLAPAVASSIYDKFKSGDFESAKNAQVSLLPLIKSMTIGKFPSALKEGMKMLGIDVGPAKAPLPRLDESEKQSLRKLLDAGEEAHATPMTRA